jgi:hypothetical protein
LRLLVSANARDTPITILLRLLYRKLNYSEPDTVLGVPRRDGHLRCLWTSYIMSNISMP